MMKRTQNDKNERKEKEKKVKEKEPTIRARFTFVVYDIILSLFALSYVKIEENKWNRNEKKKK